jgi:hypothetical protein
MLLEQPALSIKWATNPSNAKRFFEVHRSKEKLIFVAAAPKASVIAPSCLS